MMSKETKAAVETVRGYLDGRDGKPYNDGSSMAVQAVTLGIAGGPREAAPGNYGPGYKEGKEDRHNGK